MFPSMHAPLPVVCDSQLIWAGYTGTYLLNSSSTPPLHLPQLSLHNNKMHEEWTPVLGEIASWIADEPTDNNLRFGHIDGPCAANKIVEVPLLLQQKLKRTKRPRGILLVVPEFKKDHVKAALDDQRHDHLAPVQTLTYTEATDMLKLAYNTTSAEFALALMSLTTVVAKASRKMRLLTLSSEGMHPMTKSLFTSYSAPILFILPDVRENPTVIIFLRPNQKTFNIVGNILCRALNFSKVPLHGARRVPLVQSNVNELGTDLTIDLDFLTQIGIRTPTLVQVRGHFCLVLCNTRDLQVFDLRSRQICKVKLNSSKSELVEQLSWGHGVQAAPGYMQRRLYLQGLAIPDESAFGWSISPDVHEKAFFKILRIVNYDHRIAHFLCQKSEDDRVTAGKILIAAVVASDYGFEPKVVRDADEGFTTKLNTFLLRGYFGVWAVTGYIPFKVAIMEAIVDPGATSTIFNRSPTVLQDLGIQVQGHEIIEVQRKCRLLIQALKDSQVPINGMIDLSTIQPPITPARLQEIKLHLSRAYLHQIVEISTDEEGFSHAKDKLSDQPFHISEESADVLLFKTDCQGVYTSLHCSGDGGSRCMSDFTYIDEDILQKLDHELRDRGYRGLDGIRTALALGSNSYEVC
ncbi:uncharacterized protein FIESC28_04065 [Fusarium coffeatum]|uniref:Uncharacterized protein n=1 Tax=Fusarium coffeatum TaxID=231269 RepID=A0A366S333_9HYPO|nr:uncharacterized protein FIESC28_04065 [Fusarium coffeatum]RBR23070.1 hypothetical protein FIESC28_04065 [Fusarium coffeatum]